MPRRHETVEEQVRRLVREDVAIVPCDPRWPEVFRAEKAHLLEVLPADLIGRIEHFGSTAVPGLAAKPIIDILAEATDLEAAKARIVPVLEAEEYEYLWRPTWGDDGPPWYAWFIKRDPKSGARTHHIHMVEDTPDFRGHWERLRFRDYLREHPKVARDYSELKKALSAKFPNDRVKYTSGKSDFIARVMEPARSH